MVRFQLMKLDYFFLYHFNFIQLCLYYLDQYYFNYFEFDLIILTFITVIIKFMVIFLLLLLYHELLNCGINIIIHFRKTYYCNINKNRHYLFFL